MISRDTEITYLKARLVDAEKASADQRKRAIDANRELGRLQSHLSDKIVITHAELRIIVSILRNNVQVLTAASPETVERLRKVLADAGVEC